MIEKIKKNWALILETIIFLVVFFLVLKVASSENLIESIREAYGKSRFIGALLFIFYITLSQVVAPISGGSILFMAIVIFGPFLTILYTNIASFFSATIAFFIARFYGRKMVIKFTGDKYIKIIDKIAEKQGMKVLILTRTVGFPLFDYVSYAFGLSKMDYWPYILVSIVTHTFISAIMVFLFIDFQIASLSLGWNIFLAYVILFSISMGFLYFFRRIKL